MREEKQFLSVLRQDERWPFTWPGPILNLTGPRPFLPALLGADGVISIHESERSPGSMWVGRLERVGKKRYTLRTITPKCVWDDYAIDPKHRHLTQVDVLDDYGRAGLQAAGPLEE